jgi:hypothetical protein
MGFVRKIAYKIAKTDEYSVQSADQISFKLRTKYFYFIHLVGQKLQMTGNFIRLYGQYLTAYADE